MFIVFFCNWRKNQFPLDFPNESSFATELIFNENTK